MLSCYKVSARLGAALPGPFEEFGKQAAASPFLLEGRPPTPQRHRFARWTYQKGDVPQIRLDLLQVPYYATF